MPAKIRRMTNPKKVVRLKRKCRIRSRLSGTPERPRMCVFRSNYHLSVQIIDDVKGHTLVAASSLEKDLKTQVRCTVQGAQILGREIAKRALEKHITQVVFDRSGYLYHGKVKAIADAAREAGLKF